MKNTKENDIQHNTIISSLYEYVDLCGQTPMVACLLQFLFFFLNKISLRALQVIFNAEKLLFQGNVSLSKNFRYHYRNIFNFMLSILWCLFYFCDANTNYYNFQLNTYSDVKIQMQSSNDCGVKYLKATLLYCVNNSTIHSDLYISRKLILPNGFDQ